MTATTGSHYTVLARRFRPQAFDDVVGQEHVAQALRNAIRAGRVAHAYMFTGARGVGKTSTARILAKALNCPNAVDGVPCNQCEICDGISAGNDVDVLEIDGASNRGIDDIRSLRANVGVRSMRTQFKVYIIDEVHMLTKEAFNALLKTLEEPPPNVKFVFCTTEPNKVPDTILSRCQRFDFSSIDDRSIGDRLRVIAKAEGFEVAEDALELVARRARGSMRDSQSLFDQLLAFSDGTVTAEDVHRMLGTAGDERLLELFAAIVEHRPGEVLTQLDVAFGLGVQPGELMDQSIGYVRDLMVTLSGGNEVALCSVAARHRETLMQQASGLGMHSVMAAFQILSDAKNHMFRSTFGRSVLEMAMVQLSLLENLTAISDLLSGRLPALPELPASGQTAPSTSGAATSGVATSGTGASGVGEKKNIEILIPPVSDSSLYADDGSNAEEDEDSDESDDSYDSDESPADSDASLPGPATIPEPDPAVPVTFAANMTSSAAVAELSPVTPGSEATASAQTAPLSDMPTIDPADCPRLLQALLQNVGLTISGRLKLASNLVLVSPGRLEICLDSFNDHAKKVLDQPENRARIEAEVLKLTGEAISVTLRLIASERPSSAPVRDVTPVPDRTATADASRKIGANSATKVGSSRPAAPETVPQQNLLGEIDPTQDPFVRQIVSTFGATVVKVTVAPAVPVAEAESVT